MDYKAIIDNPNTSTADRAKAETARALKIASATAIEKTKWGVSTTDYSNDVDYSGLIASAKKSGASASTILNLETAKAEKISYSSDEQLTLWGINRAGTNLSTISNPYGPSDLNETEVRTLMASGSLADTKVIDVGGFKVNGLVLDGHTYEVQKDGTAIRLLSYSTTDTGGKYDYNDIDWNKTSWAFEADGKFSISNTITIKQKAESKPRAKGTLQPPFITIGDPFPVFTGEYKEVSKYSYYFGIDNLEIKEVTANMNCCFISQKISTGNLGEDGYIQLEAVSHESEGSTIEYYILDGATEHAIMPVDYTTISNEKIFPGIGTRFAIDTGGQIAIKKDGILTDVSLEKAIRSNDGLYTISYTPLDSHIYKPVNESVKVKIITRIYDRHFSAPYTEKLKLRKFGGEVLWQDI